MGDNNSFFNRLFLKNEREKFPRKQLCLDQTADYTKVAIFYLPGH
jgi:hypothetical protein